MKFEMNESGHICMLDLFIKVFIHIFSRFTFNIHLVTDMDGLISLETMIN